MTGSGSTVFAVYEDQNAAEAAFAALEEEEEFRSFQKFLTGFHNESE